jgi:polysaccharide biosynthesis protein PslH
MPPRREAPGAIPLVLHAALSGLRARHEVTLVTAYGDEAGELEAVADLRRDGVEVHAVDRRTPADAAARRRRRVRLARAWASGRDPWRTVWFAAPELQGILDELSTRQRFDVVAVEDNSMGRFRLPAAVPSVLTEHEVRRPRPIDLRPAPPIAFARKAVGELDWRRWPRYQRDVWARFDRLQVFTQRDAKRMRELAPALAGRIDVNPFGVDVGAPVPVANEQPGSLLFVGNFTHPPNRDAATWLVQEIMPRLRRRVPGVELRIAGGGDDSVSMLGGSDVRVLGEVDEIADELARAAVVVAPIRTGGGMRMKVLHALASGKPVVTTPRGAAGLNVGESDPPLVVADDAAAFAERTAELLCDAEARRALGARARAYVLEQHTPDAFARRLEAVYEAAIAAHNAG